MERQDRTLRALVVDDDEEDRHRVSGILASQGFAVQEARNGREALDRIRKNHYEMIVLDILMPYLDGFEVMKQLQTQRPEVLERTVVTSRLDMRDLNAFFPACRALPKPVSVENLSEIARNIRESGGCTDSK